MLNELDYQTIDRTLSGYNKSVPFKMTFRTTDYPHKYCVNSYLGDFFIKISHLNVSKNNRNCPKSRSFWADNLVFILILIIAKMIEYGYGN